jgi:SAM-dependent methyltransferase
MKGAFDVAEVETPTELTAEAESAEITERVRDRYAAAARQVLTSDAGAQSSASCCGGGCGTGSALNDNAVSEALYDADELATLPEEAALASLGCGNPTALIDLQAGQTVLDLGSGGGIDVLLSARRVGPTGFVYGLDMTDEMLALAQANKAKAGASNVAFLRGRIEDFPPTRCATTWKPGLAA